MFLLEPERTQFDLRWRMLGTDIRVHPMFWLVSAILGWTTDLSVLALWVGCVFVSILLHEFGHVFAGRLFGAEGHIVLYSFGGLAVGSSNLASRWQRIVVYFAGPFVQLVLFAVLYWGLFPYLIYRAEEGARFPRLFVEALDMLVEINLYWALLNLLPVWPLDGGQITRTILDAFMPGRGIRVALGISMFVAGLMAVNALAAHYGHSLIPHLPTGGLYTAFLFGLLAFSNFQELQQTTSKPWREEYPEPWERDADDWKRSRW